MVFNLSKELPYYDEKSQHRVYDERIDRMRLIDVPIRTPPLMHQIIEFLMDAREYMEESPENVLCLHCDQGTGRSGVMCCAWLLYTRQVPSAREALKHFGLTRTEIRVANKLQGVETPSQKRYVQCVDQLLSSFKTTVETPIEDLKIPPACPLRLKRIRVDNFFNKSKTVANKRFITVIYQGRVDDEGRAVWDKINSSVDVAFDRGECEFNLQKTIVRGDIRIAMFDKEIRYAAQADCDIPVGNEPGLIFSFVFHTAFVNFDSQQLVVSHNHMDMPTKSVLEGLGCITSIPYNAHGTVTLYFQGKNPWIDDNGDFFGISEAAKEAARERKVEKLKSTMTQEATAEAIAVDAYDETKSKLVNFITKSEQKFDTEKKATQLEGLPVQMAELVSPNEVGITITAEKGNTVQMVGSSVITATGEASLPKPLSPPFTKARWDQMAAGDRQCSNVRSSCGLL